MKTVFLSRFELLNKAKFANSEENMLTLSLQMLLIIFLMFMNDNGYLSIFLPIIIVPALLFKEVRENIYVWIFLSVMGSYFYLIRDLVGYVPNHKHVYAYVIIMITLSFLLKSTTERLSFIKTQSRYIIGFIFLFAVIGKFLAPEFLNGAFFEFTNITDPRFFGFTSQLGNVDFNLLKENETQLEALINTSNPKSNYMLHSSDQVTTIGKILSYWTIFIEGMVAICFCLSSRFALSKYRNVFLVIFILTTYPIATVTGFGIILTTLGFIQSLNNNKFSGYSWFYLVVYILLPLNQFPFTRLLTLF